MTCSVDGAIADGFVIGELELEASRRVTEVGCRDREREGGRGHVRYKSNRSKGIRERALNVRGAWSAVGATSISDG